MFDPGHVGQILITLLRDPAMAEATAIASVVMSLASKKKSPEQQVLIMRHYSF
jgi:hypothetical protein